MSAGDFVESRPPKPDEYIKVTHSSSSKILLSNAHSVTHLNFHWIHFSILSVHGLVCLTTASSKGKSSLSKYHTFCVSSRLGHFVHIHYIQVLISGNRDQLMDTASCLKVEPTMLDSGKKRPSECFFSGQICIHKLIFSFVELKSQEHLFFQDEKSLMWMSAVQDYVMEEPSVTYLQVSNWFSEMLKKPVCGTWISEKQIKSRNTKCGNT